MFSLFKKRPLLSADEQLVVVAAIKEAERATSGEVRVYVEKRCSYIDALDRAVEIFQQMNMQATRERNAVLVYIALKDHQLAVYGDEGIHQKVGTAYWYEEVNKMIRDFNRENYAQGIAGCVIDIGKALQHFFPYTDKDENELSDEIQFG